MALVLPTTTVVGEANAGEGDQEESAFIKARVKVEKKTIEHPGFRVNHDEEGVLTVKAGGKTHEVVITIRSGDGKTYKADVEYLRNGKRLVDAKGLEIRAKSYTALKSSSGKVFAEVWIDPTGQPDSSRKTKIKGQESEDPLG